MLHIKKVLGAKPKEHVEVELEQLTTAWGEALDPAHVLEEHPNPQFARQTYSVLNGIWKCAFVENGHDPTDDLVAVVSSAEKPDRVLFNREIVVPFSPEASLSGVNRQLKPSELLWYTREFDTPDLPGRERCLLHFQAVDYACAVFVNGTLVGTHKGGYTPFTFDITDDLVGKDNELAVCVADPSEFGGQLRGKQRFDRGDIWYSAQSGIWQTVWLETVPAAYIEKVVVEPDVKSQTLSVGIQATGFASSEVTQFAIEVFDGEGAPVDSETAEVSNGTGAAAVHIPSMKLWSPDDPVLYDIVITYGDDVVNSYGAFRTIEMCKDAAGKRRVYLNDEPLFIKGVLDQAYWPDGLMTAPSDEALVADIEAMRKAGFNLMRKHIKVETERWYYHCDRLGMLVLQDMVNGGAPEINLWHWSYKPTLFKFSWNHYRDDKPSHWKNLGAGDRLYREEWTETCRETIELLGNHPCIIGWSLFNEGWGQFQAREACKLARSTDSTRLIDAVSGWYDQQCGDFSSVHNYFRDLAVWPDRWNGRAFFISEFGGFTHRVEGHSSLEQAYGYEPYDRVEDWRRAVRELLAQAESLEPKGLVGYIYTQVSDIEEETNGILTYDRRVNKLEE